MLLEYCPGGDLRGMLDRCKKLDEDLVRKYAAEITLALGCLHKSKICYRDLKPDNVVLSKDGHCLLTDFGISK